ncbi:MAG: filamentous hemagglutinin N-terminal domain-containing protein [Sterolibacterium sp.]
MKPIHSRILLPACVLAATTAVAFAQIRTDASLGRAAQSLSGPNYLISESLGRLAGNNLFHSFQTFSINTGETANFTTTTAGLANVISRVTGGSLSQINGTLRLTAQGSTPSFFLINPAGVTFGSGASINVPGAFYVSTANYVKFSDGNFYSDTATTSTFSTASPEAFGFLGNSSATVSALNATPQNAPGQPARPSLFVGTDKPIHVVAGDVTINSSVIGNESGDVRIVALGRPSQETQVPLSGSFNAARGSLQIINGGQINSSTNSNKDVGSVQVYAGDITIDKQTASRDTGIISQADPGSSGLTGDITLIATGDLTIANGGKISSTNSATAANPDGITPSTLTIMARNISLDGGQILAETRGNVDASTVKIAAAGTQSSPYGASDFDSTGFVANGNLTLANSAWINGNTYLSGNSAPIAIKAGNLAVNGNGRGTLIVSSTLNPGAGQAALATGDGGSIAITASSLTLSKGGQIQSSTVTQGKAGAITVNSGSISIEGQQGVQTGIFATANQGSSGQAGTITLNAPNGAINITSNAAVTVQNDASVSAAQLAGINQTTLSMTGKSVTLDSNAQVSASTGGNVAGSKIEVKSLGGDITIKNGAFIQGATTGSGNAAEIDVNASGNLFLTNGSYINGNTSQSGQAAALTIQAANITLDGNGKSAIISSEAISGPNRAAATGSGNLVDITTPGTLSLINGGQIKSSSSSDGDAGMVHAHAGTILIDGQSNTNAMTGIFNVTTGHGDSKEIIITASNDLTVKGLGQINATSTAPTGNAGAITIDTGSLTVDGMKAFSGTITAPDGTPRTVNGFVYSNISSEAGTPSPGVTGDVTITAREGITLSNSGRISVSNLANVSDPSAINNLPENQKPNLTLSAKSIVLDGDGQITASTSGSVDASKIKVTATGGNIELKNGGNIVGSTTGKGNAGVLDITANGGNLSISDGGNIQSTTRGEGKAGAVTVLADNIFISGQMPGKQTGIFAAAYPNSGGQAGTLTLDASKGEISLANGALVSVQNDAMVGAEQLAKLTPTSLSMTAKSITFDSKAQILASTSGNADASSISLKSLGGNVVIKNGAAVQGATTGSGDAAAIVVNAGGDLQLSNGAFINGNTSNSGKAASISIQAVNVTLDGNGKAAVISSESNSPQLSPAFNGSGNLVDVAATGDLTLVNGGQIKSSSNSYGDSGIVRATAKNLVIDGQNSVGAMTGIFNVTTGRGDSKEIVITTGNDLTVKGLGQINATSTAPTGKAGAITIDTGSLTVDGMKSFSGKITLPDGTQRETNGFVFSNISSEAGTSSSGVTGDVTITAKETIALSDGGRISVSNLANVGNPASINSVADNLKPNLTLLGKNVSLSGNALITAETRGNVDASKIKVVAAGAQATSLDAIDIDSSSFVPAGNLTLGDRAAITGNTYSSGKAGTVTVKAGNIALDSGGKISSAADGNASGDAGSVSVTATGNLTVGAGTAITTATQTKTTGDAGSVVVSVAKDLSVLQGGQISSATGTPQGVAGSVLINTGTLLVDGIQNGKASSISASAATGSSGQTGTVSVTASGAATLSKGGTLSVQNDATVSKPASLTPTTLTLSATSITADGAEITASTSGNVAASDIKIKSSTDILLKNNTLIKGKTTGSGDAGLIEVSATGNLNMANGAAINGNTSLSGNAGAVTVTAANITLDGNGKSTPISSGTEATDVAHLADATGKGGTVAVTTPGALKLLNGGQIQSSSMTKGDAGSVSVSAGSILVDNLAGGATTFGGIFSTASGAGNSGSIQVVSGGDVIVRNQGQINATTFASGDAGIVNVSAGNLTVANGGWISSDTTGAGKAGTVTVKAGNIGLDNGGKISSTANKTASGDAGSIAVTATGNLSLGAGTAITTATQTETTGDAGSVVVNVAKDLSVLQGGQISSATSTPQGAAGSVLINTETLRVDGAQGPRASSISASAAAGSSGQTGNIEVTASSSILLSNGGKLAVQNDAFVAKPGGLPLSSLQVSAPNITLKNAQITAASTGNMPASRIKVTFGDKLALDPSSITTSSNLGNGGAIDILGGKMLVLENSQITTSVAGAAGNGGNINISSATLLMLTGFIQANTAARNASGGDVGIAAQNLVTSGNVLMLGGQTSYNFQPYTFGFNVIQAAAPTGLSGAIQLTSPALDVSASLIGLNAKFMDTGGMARNPCQATGGSSLVQAGRGGMPASARELLGPQGPPAATPDKLSAVWPSPLLQANAGWECQKG